MRFTNMRVPKENILGPVGRGLQEALTVLNYGRVTFGATCTGHAKACLKAMVEHAKAPRAVPAATRASSSWSRRRSPSPRPTTFAMEAATAECAAFIDKGSPDYMLETAILKVFATEHLWTIVNDTLQVWGGKGYFTDQPIERWMRDARINTIGEGANEVLKAFIAVVGCRGPGEYLKGLRDDVIGGRWSLRKLGAALGVGGKLVAPWLTTGTPDGAGASRRNCATRRIPSARLVREFGLKLPHVFMALKDEAKFVQAELVHERIADIAIDLYVCACVLARLDHLLSKPGSTAGNRRPDPFADVDGGAVLPQAGLPPHPRSLRGSGRQRRRGPAGDARRA